MGATPILLHAKWVLPITAPPIEDGGVLVEGNLIRSIGSFEDLARDRKGTEVFNLGDRILMPGLVNAHCHLDYTMLRRAIQPQRSFTEWIRRINALKRTLSDEDYVAGITRGFEELRRWGTTTVANIESFPELLLHMAPPLIRTWWFFEMIDIRHRETTEETVAGALAFFTPREDWLGGFGLSPHAPYTASGALFELASKTAAELDMPVTTHIAESREESEMFLTGKGELYDFMLKLGRWMFDCAHQRTPFAHVAAHAQLNSRWLLAHMNELEDSDFTLLRSMAPETRPSIVHCPGSHKYFRHRPFQLSRLLDEGVNVCLGTDSLASTDTLSMFDEMRTVAQRAPWLPPSEILKLATVNGARALGLKAGEIRAGALADLIALPAPAPQKDVSTAVLANRDPITWMMLDGKVVLP